MTRRVLITGSRHWTDEAPIRRLIESLPLDAVVIVGDCKTGADEIAIRCAMELSRAVMPFFAHWSVHGTMAGPLRNQQMVTSGKPTEAHAFPLDDSRGTWDCVRRCKAAGVPVTVHREEREARG